MNRYIHKMGSFYNRKTQGFLLGAMAVVALATTLLVAPPGPLNLMSEAHAATQNFPPNVPVYAMPINLKGAYEATVTPVKFSLPYKARLVGFSAHARTVSGTGTIDIQADGVSLLSAAISASSNIQTATIATPAVADEATITIVLTLSNTPYFADITVVPVFVR